MTDEADRAQAREERDRSEAIERAIAQPVVEAAFEIEGVRVCLDCFDPIAAPRLAANPTAVRCVECQNDHDRMNRQRGHR